MDWISIQPPRLIIALPCGPRVTQEKLPHLRRSHEEAIVVLFLADREHLCSRNDQERTFKPQSFQAQPANQNQNMQIQLSERGSEKLQMVNGMIATTRSGIEFKEHYLIVTGKDPDKRTWVLGVDDIKVIVALQ